MRAQRRDGGLCFRHSRGLAHGEPANPGEANALSEFSARPSRRAPAFQHTDAFLGELRLGKPAVSCRPLASSGRPTTSPLLSNIRAARAGRPTRPLGAARFTRAGNRAAGVGPPGGPATPSHSRRPTGARGHEAGGTVSRAAKRGRGGRQPVQHTLCRTPRTDRGLDPYGPSRVPGVSVMRSSSSTPRGHSRLRHCRSHSTARRTVSTGSSITSSGTTGFPYIRPVRSAIVDTHRMSSAPARQGEPPVRRGEAAGGRSEAPGRRPRTKGDHRRFPRAGHAAVGEDRHARVRPEQPIGRRDNDARQAARDRGVVLVAPPDDAPIRIERRRPPFRRRGPARVPRSSATCSRHCCHGGPPPTRRDPDGRPPAGCPGSPGRTRRRPASSPP